MKKEISTNAEQSFWVKIGSATYSIRLTEFRGIVYADVECDDVPVVHGAKCLANHWIIPLGVSPNGDNFRFETRAPDRFEYPNPDEFNDKFTFHYYDADEVETIEAGGTVSEED